jgi:hypothetical protein
LVSRALGVQVPNYDRSEVPRVCAKERATVYEQASTGTALA